LLSEIDSEKGKKFTNRFSKQYQKRVLTLTKYLVSIFILALASAITNGHLIDTKLLIKDIFLSFMIQAKQMLWPQLSNKAPLIIL
jgi:hypothetical protein